MPQPKIARFSASVLAKTSVAAAEVAAVLITVIRPASTMALRLPSEILNSGIIPPLVPFLAVSAPGKIVIFAPVTSSRIFEAGILANLLSLSWIIIVLCKTFVRPLLIAAKDFLISGIHLAGVRISSHSFLFTIKTLFITASV